MKQVMTGKEERGYEWIDIAAPDKNDLQEIAGQFGLHEASVADALQPDHLPKYERLKNYILIILRMYSPGRNDEADTVQELTDKLAIFISNSFIITIHQVDWPPLKKINEEYVKQGDCKNPFHVLNEIVKAGLLSFDEPAKKLTGKMEYYEERVFLKEQQMPLQKGLYYLKRKVDVIQRILLLSYDIIDQIDPPEKSDAYTRDIRDLYVMQQSIFDTLSENTNHLLTIYFNLSSQRTNETIRILTIFSVFFMPLTFIVGVYGMNFDFMPELKWKIGYPVVLILMLVVVACIYLWFKKKKWL
jgi:magnesium transporter